MTLENAKMTSLKDKIAQQEVVEVKPVKKVKKAVKKVKKIKSKKK